MYYTKIDTDDNPHSMVSGVKSGNQSQSQPTRDLKLFFSVSRNGGTKMKSTGTALAKLKMCSLTLTSQ